MAWMREFWWVQREVVSWVGKLGVAQVVEVDWEQEVVGVECWGVENCSIGGASYDDTVGVACGGVCASELL